MIEGAHRIWAEIDLDALAENMRIIKAHTNVNSKIMAIVKADAYGHGIGNVAKTMIKNGADAFGVACIDEAVQLRKAGFDQMILILGAILPNEVEKAIKYDITTTAFDYEYAEILSDTAVKMGKKASVHIKVDTGMHRIGVIADRDNAVEKILEIAQLPGIEITGIFSHFACADMAEDNLSHKQAELFMTIVKALEKKGLSIPCKHICNSAGTFKYPQYHMDMVRVGVVCYGIYPSKEISPCGLVPVMSLKTMVSRIETLKSGESVSYGATYKAEGNIKCATLMAGYADGYSRLLSDKVNVIINDRFVKIIGRICMDQCMTDVTDVNNIAVGDVATLFGRAGDKEIPVEELADIMGTINYELICMISKRVPRIYKMNGKCIDELNYITQLSKQ
ncbi:MAG: alanine racemase [Clostridia bacterium]|nr:alanine racemase [Clostridia bacterium]